MTPDRRHLYRGLALFIPLFTAALVAITLATGRLS